MEVKLFFAKHGKKLHCCPSIFCPNFFLSSFPPPSSPSLVGGHLFNHHQP